MQYTKPKRVHVCDHSKFSFQFDELLTPMNINISSEMTSIDAIDDLIFDNYKLKMETPIPIS